MKFLTKTEAKIFSIFIAFISITKLLPEQEAEHRHINFEECNKDGEYFALAL